MTILDDIIAEKKIYVDYLKSSDYLHSLHDRNFTSFSFKQAIAADGVSLIAEIKKASPSKGVINTQFDHLDLAKTYYNAGASVLSVLTDELFFQGHNSYLMDIKESVSIPILRKDFMIDPVQIEESSLLGADAVLLIAAILSSNQLQELIQCSREYGLASLCEVHDLADMEKLVGLADIDMIGINNRNLKTFDVDVNRALLFKEQFDDQFDKVLWIAESGYDRVKQLQSLEDLGFSAVLIGEGLVKSPFMIDYFKYEN
ncbi:indole-3-glycerol phosphate synthase TrpC [Candidatus Marinamargulisbacteria bacterium SCGC AG-333-B06]|nr:indole-3-glycerol phosphate synthase TrpC [Candidatus Marinamargulisbacteria bacterium SCGC AG-333-B06]